MNNQKTTRSTSSPVIAAIVLALVCWAMNAIAQTQAADTKSSPEIYQTLYLTNLTQENDANDLVRDLRNMLPTAKLMYVPSQSAISIRASAEDIALARKMLSDLDKTKKIYRLTYTMTEKDSGKTIGVQHFSIIVASGSMSVLKQGSRVPVGTNTSSAGSNEVTVPRSGSGDSSIFGRLPRWRAAAHQGRAIQYCGREVQHRNARSHHPADHARGNVNPGAGQNAGARLTGCSRKYAATGSRSNFRVRSLIGCVGSPQHPAPSHFRSRLTTFRPSG